MSTPKRIQRRRVKGWRAPEGAIYVGRGTKWGNPWRVDDGMSARDDLAKAVDSCCWCPYDPPSTDEIVDAVIAAGWRPPVRTIETVEELADLPAGSVLIDRQRLVHKGTAVQKYSRFLLRRFGPLTVLWEPGDDDE